MACSLLNFPFRNVDLELTLPSLSLPLPFPSLSCPLTPSRYSSRPTAANFCRQAVGRWPNIVRLQHPKGVYPAFSASAARGREEAQEEELHHTKENQAQTKEGEDGYPEVL